ncbi:MAG TPA: 2-oxoacid:acceptor oxidoreductase family protein [Opitutaceae bacterium]|nr:2-oxoacid:acceptor oxidoreductase family protein [Opitutaceae bacterium]
MSSSAAGESAPASQSAAPKSPASTGRAKPKYPGVRVTCNGNQLVTQHVETRITEGGVFYPITPSTEGGEIYQQSYAQGELNVWGQQKVAVETEGEHAAQGGATAFAVTGRRTVNFTSGQGLAYAMEQYYHAPGKLSTMVLEVGARALTKHALNVHCGHDDFYGVLDTGWTMLVAKDAQQAADQAVILRRVNELSLNPGMNIQDGMLTTHSERMYLAPEAEFLREYLGAVDDVIDCPTPAQRELFGPRRRRVPAMMDLRNPILLGPVQNQEHHMNGVVARRNNFNEAILPMLVEAYAEFGRLTGRHYGLIEQYRTEDADTVFVSLGCAADNIEAACDYLREQRNAKVGSIHVNVIRPFPEAAVVEALRGKKRVIVLERTDEGMAGDNPLARDIRVALGKANEAARFASDGHPHNGNGSGAATREIPTLAPEETPRLFRGAYGIGSRDFRPEHTLGAYEFATGQTPRQDGRTATEGETYFVLGVDHPYAVISRDTPSLLPEGAIAVRFHSIGGWGMITTGKNLGELVGEFGRFISERDATYDADGFLVEKLYVMANPKYGSEKKGAPTNYYLTVAPSPIKVNCELNHVDVVLCCDPKAFTHTNPLEGLKKGGCLVWESSETPATAWERIPSKYRQWIRDNAIRVFILPGFDIARKATNQTELQLRMQGNSFLGAFFRVSPFLEHYRISEEKFHESVRKQYVKKFGRFGDAVVASNMTVMTEGFSRVAEIAYGAPGDADRSSMRNPLQKPIGSHAIIPTAGCAASGCDPIARPPDQPARAPFQTLAKFDAEYRNGLGYHQPASALASLGVMGAGTGATQSKYVARRETPVYIAENCTQCMECITACPDTALPNLAQEVGVVLRTAINNYVSDVADRRAFGEQLGALEQRARARMNEAVKTKARLPFKDIVREEVAALASVSPPGRAELTAIIDKLPLAYSNVPAIFRSLEAKTPGSGGLFSIFVSDLCKGCGECVQVCGDHDALRMTRETEELNATLTTAQVFSRLLPDTPQKFLGLYNDADAAASREAALRNHLMVRRNYEALVSGDGACAGCGEKSILRACASVTEAFMRPMYHRKAARLRAKAEQLEKEGAVRLEALQQRDPKAFELYRKTFTHAILGLGGENDADTARRIADHEARHGAITVEQIVAGLVAVLRQDAFNHQDLQSVDGRRANGMSVMMMGASTGCNTVYGSTPPSNPHPYPWMNSLFQDGATISWLMAESAILLHARRSVVPERLVDALFAQEPAANDTSSAHRTGFSESDYFTLTHLDDALMTEQEIRELPKIWVIGGDGALGDIGFQNVSKVVLQNRPNVKMLMLDTQVYSNTGGQNSDSSTMLGGYDMNQFGVASQGKLIEKKNVAEAFTSGHGSPFVAQVSMANAAKLYKAILDGLEYRGTAFFQCYTTCQPEHGVGDNMSADQAKMVRDARGMPEFVFNPRRGETSAEAFDLKGNPTPERDWWRTKYASTGGEYNFTVAHWAVTEGRFRKHVKAIPDEDAAKLVPFDDMLLLITQDDVIHRRVFDPHHRSHVPNFGCYIQAEVHGKMKTFAVSRQMVLFAVERRKAWRMLQSKAGVANRDYLAQKAFLAKVDKGEISLADAKSRGRELVAAETPKT